MIIKVKVEFTFDISSFQVPSINGIQAYINAQPEKFIKDADAYDVFAIEVDPDTDPTEER